MANDFYTPEKAAELAAKLTAEDGELSALVSKNSYDELMAPGKGGAPVSIKVPTTLFARERDLDDVTSQIILDEIAEKRETFNLDRKHDYSAVPLSEADLNLNLANFSEQVLEPQTGAIADKLEHKVATKLLGVPLTTDLVSATVPGEEAVFDVANPVPFFTAVRKRLRDNGVSAAGLKVVAGTAVYAALLDAGAITDVSQSGSTDALREAGVGKIRGFNIIESTRVSEWEILVFHSDAVTLITRAPAVPAGASFGASTAARGISMRYLRDYDAMRTVDRSIVSTFSAVAILPTYKVVKNFETRTATLEPLENGGILHLDATPASGGATS